MSHKAISVICFWVGLAVTLTLILWLPIQHVAGPLQKPGKADLSPQVEEVKKVDAEVLPSDFGVPSKAVIVDGSPEIPLSNYGTLRMHARAYPGTSDDIRVALEDNKITEEESAWIYKRIRVRQEQEAYKEVQKIKDELKAGQ